MAAPDPSTTLLRLSGAGVPDFSARGLRQTLDPIPQAFVPKRTINGVLKNIAASQFQKYKSTITGDDQAPPALDGIWQAGNIIVTADCVAELGYLTAGGSPEKPVVASRFELAWTYYRPRLQMLVVGFKIERDEYGAQVSWQLDLEEV